MSFMVYAFDLSVYDQTHALTLLNLYSGRLRVAVLG